jgi:hypothetical protein
LVRRIEMAEEQKQQDRQTLAQRLLEVDTAIHAVLLGGQSYKLGTRSVTRADLALLRKMRDDLAAQLQQEDNGNLMGGVVVAVFEGR